MSSQHESHPGESETCRYNAKQITKHETKLEAIEGRLDTFEHLLREVREKLFDGYDMKITHTNQKVTEIAAAIKALADKGGIDMAEVEVLVSRKIEEHDTKALSKKQWVKNHRIEILSVFVGVCTLVILILAFLRG